MISNRYLKSSDDFFDSEYGMRVGILGPLRYRKIKDVILKESPVGYKGAATSYIGIRLDSINHTYNALEELKGAMMSEVAWSLNNIGEQAVRSFRNNSQGIAESFRNGWKRFTFAKQVPPPYNDGIMPGTFFTIGVGNKPKYYEEIGKGGGRIIDWLNYGTKPYHIRPKKRGFRFTWNPNPRTGSPGASPSLPEKGSKVFLGLPPTRDYLKHPGIAPFGFIEKTMQEIVPRFSSSVRRISKIKIYVGK